MLNSLLREIKNQARPARAKASAWFFKTGPGQYGEGDVFVGLSVPQMRQLAKKHINLSFSELEKLLGSKIHEHRFIALEILVMRYENGDTRAQKSVAGFYRKHIRGVNNWDLVDTSAPYILGDYLLVRPRDILYRLARSKNVWERRIAIVSTFAFIGQGQFVDTLKISEMLVLDDHDLIQKAAGWALREVGKRDKKVLEGFLRKHSQTMPRTMLRYALEKFLPAERRKYMRK